MFRYWSFEKKYLDCSDAELVEAFQSGNNEVFSVIDNRFRPRILRFLSTRVSSQELVEELTQETLVRAYASLKTLRDGVFLAGWIKRIAYNVFIDRTRLIMKERCYDSYDESEFNDDDGGTGISRMASEASLRPIGTPFFSDYKRKDYELNDECENIWRIAKDSLTAVEFQIMWLRYEDELDDKEIARSLGKSHSSIRTALSRARSKLALFFRDAER